MSANKPTYTVNGLPVNDPAFYLPDDAEQKEICREADEVLRTDMNDEEQLEREVHLPDDIRTPQPFGENTYFNEKQPDEPIHRQPPAEAITEAELDAFDAIARASFERELAKHPDIRPGSKEAEDAVRDAIRGK